MKRLFTGSLLICLFALVACQTAELPSVNDDETLMNQDDIEETAFLTAYEVFEENPLIEIVMENDGTIILELMPEYAPVTVSNFVQLTRDGFFDGLTFHRILNGFMMQGGDPLGNGFGGSEMPIVGEMAHNGFDNPLLHTRGAISMAHNGQNFNGATSQFFIMHQDAPHLNGIHAVFGYVIEGMDVVDAIISVAEPIDNNGTIATEAQPVMSSVRMLND